MQIPKINFLNCIEKEYQKKKKLLPKLLFYPLIFLTIFILVFSVQIIFSGEGIINSLEKINIFNFGLSTSKDKLLKGEAQDRVNILLLGMGGEGHPGPYLTDTMILVSLMPSQNKVSFISIPRDLSVPIPGYGWRKINNANSFGETQKSGTGGQLASDVVSKVFGITVDYYIRLDFAGFEKLIDEFGGLKIYVENGFTDTQFPNDDFSDNPYGYQNVSFTSGWQTMDGKTALNYARSRHGTNGESSDFARSKRQQQVLKALKDQVFSFTTFLSYRKISALLNLYKDHIATNLNTWEIFKLARLAMKIDSSNITNLVIEAGMQDSPLYATMINGAYLLLPKDMSFYQLQQMVKYVFEPEKEVKAKEKIKLEIQNGTKIEGLAYQTSIILKNKGYEIIKISNASQQNYEKTTIYDLTNGQKPDELENLKNYLNSEIATEKPSSITTSNIDFLIILGQDRRNLSKTE